MSGPDGAPAGLAALEARLREEMAYLELPAKPWVIPRRAGGEPVKDVTVVGAGMCGLAATAQLRFLGIDNVACIDRAPRTREGPWMTTARMRTLRSPKQLAGPALHLPSLTFRAWYEARFGAAAWDALGKIPRPLWMDYLVWYRETLRLPVSNGVALRDIEPTGDRLLRLSLEDAATGRRHAMLTRRLVLATGRDGLGGPDIPAFVRGIDRRYWAHSADDIDFAALGGRRVGVVGAGASAMDNAGTALEAGAASVDLFIRRADIPRINKLTGIGSPGVVHGFAGLPDAWKWKFLHYAQSEQTPPPADSVRRVSEHRNARFHLSSPVERLEVVGDHLRLRTARGDHALDFLILATGFVVDLGRRPELSRVAPHIRFWRDRFVPEAGEEDAELAASPDLGPAFEFLEKTPGQCPALAAIHCFNFPATLSHGKLSGDVPAVSDGVDRLARGIARSLFVEDRALYFESLKAYAVPELKGDEWVDAEARATGARTR